MCKFWYFKHVLIQCFKKTRIVIVFIFLDFLNHFVFFLFVFGILNIFWYNVIWNVSYVPPIHPLLLIHFTLHVYSTKINFFTSPILTYPEYHSFRRRLLVSSYASPTTLKKEEILENHMPVLCSFLEFEWKMKNWTIVTILDS